MSNPHTAGSREDGIETATAPHPQGNDESPALLTTRQVADLLNCGERTVWRWSRSGVMPHPVRIGGAVRFRREEIERWIEAGCPRVDGGLRGVR